MSSAEPMIERRVGLLFACFLLLFCVAIGRAAWVQGVQGGRLGADAQSQHTQTVTIPGPARPASSTAEAGSWPCRRTRQT